MDIETLTNHISGLSKHYFDNACRIVLNDVFKLNAINIDGKNDGGSDFVAFADFLKSNFKSRRKGSKIRQGSKNTI